MHDSFFRRLTKTGVSMDEAYLLRHQHADFSDERQVKKIVRKVSKCGKTSG
jgi:hypothetical protein